MSGGSGTGWQYRCRRCRRLGLPPLCKVRRRRRLGQVLRRLLLLRVLLQSLLNGKPEARGWAQPCICGNWRGSSGSKRARTAAEWHRLHCSTRSSSRKTRCCNAAAPRCWRQGCCYAAWALEWLRGCREGSCWLLALVCSRPRRSCICGPSTARCARGVDPGLRPSGGFAAGGNMARGSRRCNRCCNWCCNRCCGTLKRGGSTTTTFSIFSSKGWLGNSHAGLIARSRSLRLPATTVAAATARQASNWR